MEIKHKHKCKPRILALMLSLCMLVPAVPVSATEASPTVAAATWSGYQVHPSPSDIANRPDAALNQDQYKQNYTKQMSGQNALSSYMINAQPSDAIVFNSTSNSAIVCEATPVEVSTVLPRGKNQLSVNYEKGVLDLPRLDARYYYNIVQVGTNLVNAEEETTYGLSVKRTLYPTLSWTGTIPANTSVILAVCSADTNQQLKQVTVSFATEQPGLPSSWSDCSEFVLEDILNSEYGSIYRTAPITWYPAELHRSCIVTSQFIVGHNDIWGPGGDDAKRNTFGFFIKTFPTSSGNNTPVADYIALHNITEYEYFRNNGSTVDVKRLVYPYISGTQKPEYFAVFMPHLQGVTYNANRGTVSTANNNAIEKQYNVAGTTKTYKGIYAVCHGTEFNIFAVLPSAFSGDLNTIDDNAPSKALTNGSDFNIEEQYGKYGFFEWAKSVEAQGFDISSYPTIKYTGSDRKSVNLYNSAMAFGGVKPHVARIDGEKPIEHYTVTTWYHLPDSLTSNPTKCEELVIPIGGQAPSLKSPTTYVPMYTFDRWYTDQACTVPADMNVINQNAKPNDAISLYGKYTYTGGTYTVQFYNDATGESSSQTFECREQPTLPPTPTQSGYLFRNWQIVYNTASTSGTPYDPSTFAPMKDQNYLFKTFWDIEGVITNVSTTANEYYVGDSIDKSKVVVTVQTDNNGSTRTLNTDEFTVSPDKVGNTGRNQILVTYTATGATATFDVTGKQVQPVSLTARYTGTALNVGATVSRSNITCTVNYNNGKTENITDFTIAPTTIANAGANTIRVIYGSLSTTVTVTGNRPQNGTGTGNGNGSGNTVTKPTTGTNKPSNGTGSGSTGTNRPGSSSGSNNQSKSRLQAISASYTGAQPYVGDVLKATDISVTATYQDGSTTTLSSTAFQFSPSYIRNSGENTITVSYGGLTTTFTVSAALKTDTSADAGLTNPGNNSSAGSVIGVDENGNPIYSGSSGGGSTTTDSTSPVGTGTVLGNPLTGAGMPSSDKGTSTGYLRGSNILTSRLYGGATSVTNTLDILAEINAAGETASSVDIELYNGAADNDITAAMLEALKEKDLTLNITMLNPDDKSTQVGRWSVMGGSLTDTSKQFSPNISFEVTDKGAETLTYIAIADGEYPDNTVLDVSPALGTYESGELIRIYTCGFDKSDAHIDSVFTWSDVSNVLNFDITKSKRYALSNALDAYEEGQSLLADISRPSENTADDQSEESSDEDGEDEPFDFGDDEDFWNDSPDVPTGDEKESKGFPWVIVISGILAVVALAGGAICFVKLRHPKVIDEGDNNGEFEEITYDEEAEFGDSEDEYFGDDEDFDPEITEEGEES